MSGTPLAMLLQLLEHHPELQAIRARSGPGRRVAAAAPELGRLLLGASEAVQDPLLSALLVGAPDEVAILVGLCRGNLMRTLTTTISIMVFLADFLDRDPEPGPQDDAEGDGGTSLPSGGEMVHQAFDAVARQGEVLDTLSELLPGMGWGFGRGQLESALLQDLERFSALLSRAETLRQIASELGRMERSSRRRRTPKGGRDEVVGVHMGGNLSEVLPVEQALLGTPTTADLFYQRYTERRLLSLEYEGARSDHRDRRSGSGPIIACIDTSASMSGFPEVVAKALVLAVMRHALPRGRRVRLMLFGGPGEFEDRDIGRGTTAMGHFLDFMAMGFRSGTDFDGPLERALDLLAEARYTQADVLVVTDGYARASSSVVERVQRLRAELGFEVVSAVIGDSVRGVAAFSDRVWTISNEPGGLESISLTEWLPDGGGADGA